MPKDFLFASESVNEGHPDKVCDQIADALLDSLIAQDADSRVAVECMVTTGSVHVAGEVTTKGFADVQQIVRGILKEVGYTDPEFGIDYQDAGVWVSLHDQSGEIARGVGNGGRPQGAGDQGMMFGFACDETPELMPLPIMIAHRLCMRLSAVRRERLIPGLGPDGKSLVTVEYRDGRPARVASAVIAQQHGRSIVESRLRQEIIDKVIKPVCGSLWDDSSAPSASLTRKKQRCGLNLRVSDRPGIVATPVDAADEEGHQGSRTGIVDASKRLTHPIGDTDSRVGNASRSFGLSSFLWPTNWRCPWLRRPPALTTNGESARCSGCSAPTSPSSSPVMRLSSPSDSESSGWSGSPRQWSAFWAAATTAGVLPGFSAPTQTADWSTSGLSAAASSTSAPPAHRSGPSCWAST
jgi:hypothetical protein